VTLSGLPGLYECKYVLVNVLNGDSCTSTCINWVVLPQLASEQIKHNTVMYIVLKTKVLVLKSLF
jgi:hypothetical protein